LHPTSFFFQQDVASFEMDDDDESDGVVPQRRVQVSQEHEDLVVKGEERRFMTFLGFAVQFRFLEPSFFRTSP